MLGPEWVEVEPGVYEHRPLRTTEPPPTPPTPPPSAAWEALDEELLGLDEELRESLPKRPDDPEAESSALSQSRRSGGLSADEPAGSSEGEKLGLPRRPEALPSHP